MAFSHWSDEKMKTLKRNGTSTHLSIPPLRSSETYIREAVLL